jgi:hypothetical protein
MVQGPGTNEFKQSYWLKALNWSPRPFDEESKSKKWPIESNMAPVLEGKIHWLGPKHSANKESL